MEPPSIQFTTVDGTDSILRQEGKRCSAITFEKTSIRVGTLTISDLRLDDASVAPLHAFVKFDAGKWWVIDIGSEKGTFVNNEQVIKRSLQNGDAVTFGNVSLLAEFDEVEELFKLDDASLLKRGSLRYAEGTLYTEDDVYCPTNDGEAYLWELLQKQPEMTRSEIRKVCERDRILEWGYVRTCIDFMLEDEAIVEETHEEKEPSYCIAPAHREVLQRRRCQEIERTKPTSFCEQCFYTQNKLVELTEVETILTCPLCKGVLKLNQDKACHFLGLKLKHYKALARRLGLLLDAPQTRRLNYLRSELKKLIQHWKNPSPKKRLETVDDLLKHIVQNLQTILSRSYEKEEG